MWPKILATACVLLTLAPIRAQSPGATLLAPLNYEPVQTQPSPAPAPQSLDDQFGLALPDRERLFRLESEPAFRQRLAQELPGVKNIQFPQDVPLPPETITIEIFPRQSVGPVTYPICYRPLYFEDKATERYGQYVPCVQPLLSLGIFYCDVLTLPCSMLTKPPWTFECDLP